MTLDMVDDAILVEYTKTRAPSINDLSKRIGKSKTAIYARLMKLEELNLLTQPTKKAHRSRTLTMAGRAYLKENGLAK